MNEGRAGQWEIADSKALEQAIQNNNLPWIIETGAEGRDKQVIIQGPTGAQSTDIPLTRELDILWYT